MKLYRQYDDEDDRALRDGEIGRVPLLLRDAALSPLQRQVAAHAARVTDCTRGTAGLHRPGFRVTNDAAMRDEKEEAYDEYQRDLVSAYKRDARKIVQRDPAGRLMSTLEEEGDDDLRDASTLDGMTIDQMQRDHQECMSRGYQAYDSWIEQQWRNP